MAATTPRQSPSGETKDCKLLELSGELRNRIYEYTLCEEEPITIDRYNLEEPPLLLACKQIREEASSIYYGENDFEFEVPNFDLDVAIEYFRRPSALKYHNDNRFTVRIYPDVPTGQITASWPNLLRWLRAYHDNKVPLFCGAGPKEEGHYDWEQFNVAECAFDTVQTLRDEGTRWEVIEEVLMYHKRATEAIMSWTD